ncbi:MAG: alpha/beta hydrolase family esterase, partial [Acidimicrobiales bacterium]
MQRDGTHPPRPPARRGAAALASALLVATLLATGCSSSAKTTIGSGASTGSSQGTADGRTGATDAGGETADTPSAEPTAVSQAPAQPSPGCSGNPELPAGATTEHLQVGADARIYRRFIPPALTPGKPVPVVINIHGLSSNIDGEVAATRFEDLAATEGFIVLTPQGLGPVPHWEGANDPSNTDLPFFGAMLDKVESDACVDIARVYSTGISNGGIMSSILACQMGNRIAAVGLVSGIRTQEGCASDKATPAMVFWGRQDVILPFFGGVGPGLKAITD